MPFAASDRNCSFAAKTRKLSYATNFTKPHGIQQNRMAGYPKIMCHLHGRLYPLFRPVQCISRGKVESGIQSLGQHLRFISPALRTPVRHDDRRPHVPRPVQHDGFLQKTDRTDRRSTDILVAGAPDPVFRLPELRGKHSKPLCLACRPPSFRTFLHTLRPTLHSRWPML